VQALLVVFIKYPRPASTVTVEPVTTAVDQSRPPGVAAIVPDALATLFTIVPLIIFFYNLLSYYALDEYPAAAIESLAVPTPVTSEATTPLLETKFFNDERAPEICPYANSALSPP